MTTPTSSRKKSKNQRKQSRISKHQPQPKYDDDSSFSHSMLIETSVTTSPTTRAKRTARKSASTNDDSLNKEMTSKKSNLSVKKSEYSMFDASFFEDSSCCSSNRSEYDDNAEDGNSNSDDSKELYEDDEGLATSTRDSSTLSPPRPICTVRRNQEENIEVEVPSSLVLHAIDTDEQECHFSTLQGTAQNQLYDQSSKGQDHSQSTNSNDDDDVVGKIQRKKRPRKAMLTETTNAQPEQYSPPSPTLHRNTKSTIDAESKSRNKQTANITRIVVEGKDIEFSSLVCDHILIDDDDPKITNLHLNSQNLTKNSAIITNTPSKLENYMYDKDSLSYSCYNNAPYETINRNCEIQEVIDTTAPASNATVRVRLPKVSLSPSSLATSLRHNHLPSNLRTHEELVMSTTTTTEAIQTNYHDPNETCCPIKTTASQTSDVRSGVLDSAEAYNDQCQQQLPTTEVKVHKKQNYSGTLDEKLHIDSTTSSSNNPIDGDSSWKMLVEETTNNKFKDITAVSTTTDIPVEQTKTVTKKRRLEVAALRLDTDNNVTELPRRSRSKNKNIYDENYSNNNSNSGSDANGVQLIVDDSVENGKRSKKKKIKKNKEFNLTEKYVESDVATSVTETNKSLHENLKEARDTIASDEEISTEKNSSTSKKSKKTSISSQQVSNMVSSTSITQIDQAESNYHDNNSKSLEDSTKDKEVKRNLIEANTKTKSVDTKLNLPTDKKTSSTTIKTKKASFQDQVLNLLLSTFKPYTIKSLADTLKVSDTQVEFLMLSLVDKGAVFKKEFATAKRTITLYWVDYDNKTVVKALLEQASEAKPFDIEQTKQELLQLRHQISTTNNTLQNVLQTPTNDDLDKIILEEEAILQQLNNDLNDMKVRISKSTNFIDESTYTNSSSISTKQTNLTKKHTSIKSNFNTSKKSPMEIMRLRIDFMKKVYKERKIKCNDFVEELADAMDKKPSIVRQMLDLELD